MKVLIEAVSWLVTRLRYLLVAISDLLSKRLFQLQSLHPEFGYVRRVALTRRATSPTRSRALLDSFPESQRAMRVNQRCLFYLSNRVTTVFLPEHIRFVLLHYSSLDKVVNKWRK